ncbi:hypothetical protein OsJ_26015 [Oryza sativa Japonica Group]|uniref:Uncharacterized protein n=1 Tax=Oryza sativa subsp. japonica TaxID=39947 RepID=A3BPK2_ORYSJ|nr:hypothetical protein OsJ_26015 [Oryza sativa Japonica Group]
MRKSWGLGRPSGDRRWLLPFAASLLVSATLFLAAACGLFSPPSLADGDDDSILIDVATWDTASAAESEIKNRLLDSNSDSDDGDNPDDAAVNSDASSADPPRIAYLLEGTKGDGARMRRALQAIYHPRNQYILHLDLEAPPRERIDLAMYVKGDAMFSEVGNVRVIAKEPVTYKGQPWWPARCTPSPSSSRRVWSGTDILHVFSSLPRNLNFIEHMQLSGWKVISRAKPIVVDPGLYLSKKFDLTMTTERRELPTSFKLYTGSAWIMLTKTFLEYCIWGWDNLPRTLLMYYVNFISSPEGYFHTVICNSDEFRGTAVGHDLHYIAWDYPPKQHPNMLSMKDFNKMVKSGAPFARKFPKDDKVLDKIDRELLHRSEGQFTPGAWCDGSSEGGADPCSSRGEDSVFEPSPGAERLRGLMKKVLSWDYRNGSCSSLGYDQTKRDWYVPKGRG